MAFPVNEGRTIPDLPGTGDYTRSGAGSTGVSSWAEMDRQIYGSRFNLLLSEGRSDDTSYTGTLRSYKSDDNTWKVPSFGSVFTVPDHLPGSENKTSRSGTAVADRGGLICRSYARNATVEFGIRKVVLNGSGGLTSAGAWVTAKSSTHSAGAFDWVTARASGINYLLYPSGVNAGDTIQLYVAFRVDGTYAGSPAYLAAYEVFEPNLVYANP